MKLLLSIMFLLASCPAATAQDFYSLNESLLNDNKQEMVRANSLAELKIKKDSIEATYFLALLAYQQKSGATSEKYFSDDEYEDQFQKLYRADAEAKRMMYGNQIMLSDVRYVKLFHILGLKYLSRQDFPKAVEWLNLAEVGYSDNADFNFNIGCSYYGIKAFDKAKKYFQSSLRIDPRHHMALYNLASIWAIESNPDESVKWLEKAIKLDARYKQIVLKDPDFDAIRNSPKYKRLVAK